MPALPLIVMPAQAGIQPLLVMPAQAGIQPLLVIPAKAGIQGRCSCFRGMEAKSEVHGFRLSRE